MVPLHAVVAGRLSRATGCTMAFGSKPREDACHLGQRDYSTSLSIHSLGTCNGYESINRLTRCGILAHTARRFHPSEWKVGTYTPVVR